MAAKKQTKTVPKQASKKPTGPTPEKIVASLKTIYVKRKIPWPLRYPTKGNIKPGAQDYGFIQEIQACLATELGWDDLLAFIGTATGTVPKRVEWTRTYREALALVHVALGIDPSYDGEVEPVIPDRAATLKIWGIDESQLEQGETTMAKQKAVVTKKSAPESTQAKPNKKISTTPIADVPKSTEPAKTNKPAVVEKTPLPDESYGGLLFGSSLLEALAEYVRQASTETTDKRVGQLAEVLKTASALFNSIVE